MLIEMQKNLKIELCCSPVSEVLRSTTKCIRRSYLTLAESERVNSLAAAPRGGRRCPGPIAVLEPPFLRPMAVTCLLLKATTSASPFQLRSVAAGHRRRRSPIITSGLVAASPPPESTNMLANTAVASYLAGAICWRPEPPPARLARRRLPPAGSSYRARAASNGFRTRCMKVMTKLEPPSPRRGFRARNFQ